ncbi:MAG: nucleotidyltransferase family protein [Gammaproteobacteria bacterium]|nr:nucleotidyltransferase family protein [Gammaproteobacteria bacterium]MCW8911289.1 nucleotidyltransferase family protein [Gammaproteobacteria bacterium]MCW9004500.1 nucleotidyltransferase family protein [Gammaproteobacteria bacterium]
MKSLPLLLKAISTDKKDLDIESFSSKAVLYAIESGLGPYLNHYLHNNSRASQSEYVSEIISADLTAKLITNTQLSALQEIINTSLSLVDEIILLKGISTCQNFYPLPHFRIMGDIDLLVSEKDQAILENILVKMGYQQKSQLDAEFYQTHHHSMPFHNTNNNVWIEVHTHIFPPSSAVIDDKFFSLKNIKNNCISLNNERYPEKIKCLCPELQLIHTCVHMAEDFNIHKGFIQLVDMILIIKNNKKGLDWHKITNWTNNTSSASYLYLLLSYFNKNDIIDVPDQYLKSIKLKNSNMGFINRWILHSIISMFMDENNHQKHFMNVNILEIIWNTLLQPKTSLTNIMTLPWNILFPLDSVNRSKFSFFRTRIKNLIKSVHKT